MKTVVTRRVVRNKRLGQAAYLWALPMLAHSPGAHAHFTARRQRGDSYSAAARNLTNRGMGMLHHCLQTPTALRRVPGLPEPTRSSRDLWQTFGARRPSTDSGRTGNQSRRQAVSDLYRASGQPGPSKDRGTTRLTTRNMRCL
jgi:hypothetical protein